MLTVFYQLNDFFIGSTILKKVFFKLKIEIDQVTHEKSKIGDLTYVLNCFKKILIFKLLFPSKSVISEFSFLDFRSLPLEHSAEFDDVSRAPIFGEFCVLVAC